MDRRRGVVGGGERLGQLLVGVVVDIDQAEIVVLAVGAATFRVVVILEPLRADDFRQGGEVARRRGGAAGALGLGRDGHQMAVVAIAGAVLARREEPLGDQHRLVAGQLFQPVEEIARDPAVRSVNVVVGRDRVDMRRHRLDRGRVVVDRQAVAEIERLGIGGADRPLGEVVIALGDNPGPFPHRRYAMPARAQHRQLFRAE